MHRTRTTGVILLVKLFGKLDNPGELFFEKKTGKLYLFHSGTGAPSASSSVVAPQKHVLVKISVRSGVVSVTSS